MSDLIALIRSETDTRRIERTLRRGREAEAGMWGWPATPAGRLVPRPTCQPLHCNVGSPLPPRLHLRRSLSRFDPRAHVGRSSLYISAPALLKTSSHLRRQKP